MTKVNPLSSGEGKYVQANGLHMYYEEYGSGAPVILLHGGTLSSASWAPQIPNLARSFRVLTLDSRGHGRTNNPGGTLSYRMIADDVAAFIHALGLTTPSLLATATVGKWPWNWACIIPPSFKRW